METNNCKEIQQRATLMSLHLHEKGWNINAYTMQSIQIIPLNTKLMNSEEEKPDKND